MNASVFYTPLTYCTLRSCNYHCVSRVFIFFYLQVWNNGVWCFDSDFSLGFSLYLFCIKKHSYSSLSPSITVVTVDPTSAKLYLHNSSLWAVMRWLANFLWAPVLFMQEKHTLSEIFHQAQCGRDCGKSRSWTRVTFWQLCRKCFHMDPCWIIKPW